MRNSSFNFKQTLKGVKQLVSTLMEDASDLQKKTCDNWKNFFFFFFFLREKLLSLHLFLNSVGQDGYIILNKFEPGLCPFLADFRNDKFQAVIDYL